MKNVLSEFCQYLDTEQVNNLKTGLVISNYFPEKVRKVTGTEVLFVLSYSFRKNMWYPVR